MPGAAFIRVIASQTVLADIAQQVAGQRLTVRALIPVGVDPHSYEPTPQDMAAVAGSNVFIVNGMGLEAFLDKLVQNAGGERLVIEASAGLTSRTAREGEEAVLSPEERAEALCNRLPDAEGDVVTLAAEQDAAPLLGHAPEHDQADHKDGDHAHEHPLERFTLKAINQGAAFAGYARLEVREAGEYLLALPAGRFALFPIGQDRPVEVEVSFAV
ncbi:MAG: zinc ABC transporter substrate-binding protein, partial [Anaerolineae bacterium]|nr:zinc ABC transporter substrate-binding protein [Thermoflexales bacterium]MDW8407508.1 zinc ABC transporter substrate-binding protein [Anaerolineae bacterium]